ncbi:MAG: dihydropteroate synthase [Candidatus Cloacimonetes bacterium]|nr:dihydropteroate synthase [Candidatus Cloacimonadota bacterium]
MKTNYVNLMQVSSPEIMGILNLTEDSFSDGSLYLDKTLAIKRALEMIKEGAAIIDLGAESTKPGSQPVSEEQELARIIPILKTLKREHPAVRYSIDTRKASVAKATLDCGADIVNDISALRYDDKMAETISNYPKAKLILMHMQGEPQTMQNNPHYSEVLSDILAFFKERIDYCISEGIRHENIMLDPGIGFGKNLVHNLKLLANLDYFNQLGMPLVLGASRKSFINTIATTDVSKRIEGSLAAAAWGAMQGVEVIRCHDVLAHVKFLQVFSAIAKERRISSVSKED